MEERSDAAAYFLQGGHVETLKLPTPVHAANPSTTPDFRLKLQTSYDLSIEEIDHAA